MKRLCEDGRATFVILDDNPLYTADDLEQICKRNDISDDLRSTLWRQLETAGRAYLDRRRLQSQPNKLGRIRQDLRLGRQLATQLAEIAPEPGQVKDDRGSVALSRCHLSALREGERLTGSGIGPGARLDEMKQTLEWIAEVYEAALETCTRSGEEAEELWRASMTEFYTRTLTRPWTGDGIAAGERFLADCRKVLDQGEALDVPPITAINLATTDA